jgi:MoaA/NifB/PqqE/SkfB family radical SAM enzyme
MSDVAFRTRFFSSRKILNIDLTYRCPIECPKCRRQYLYKSHGLPVPGKDLEMMDFKKILKFFDKVIFEGQKSDPIHHPLLIQMLDLCRDQDKSVEIHTASSYMPFDWYIKAFKSNRDAKWVFSIDGLPEQSHLYRVNQDGVKLFNVMVEAVKYLNQPPTWQYIVFKYNEESISQAIDIAAQNNLKFYLLQSSRWSGDDDPLMPSEKYRMSKKWE